MSDLNEAQKKALTAIEKVEISSAQFSSDNAFALTTASVGPRAPHVSEIKLADITSQKEVENLEKLRDAKEPELYSQSAITREKVRELFDAGETFNNLRKKLAAGIFRIADKILGKAEIEDEVKIQAEIKDIQNGTDKITAQFETIKDHLAPTKEESLPIAAAMKEEVVGAMRSLKTIEKYLRKLVVAKREHEAAHLEENGQVITAGNNHAGSDIYSNALVLSNTKFPTLSTPAPLKEQSVTDTIIISNSDTVIIPKEKPVIVPEETQPEEAAKTIIPEPVEKPAETKIEESKPAAVEETTKPQIEEPTVVQEEKPAETPIETKTAAHKETPAEKTTEETPADTTLPVNKRFLGGRPPAASLIRTKTTNTDTDEVLNGKGIRTLMESRIAEFTSDEFDKVLADFKSKMTELKELKDKPAKSESPLKIRLQKIFKKKEEPVKDSQDKIKALEHEIDTLRKKKTDYTEILRNNLAYTKFKRDSDMPACLNNNRILVPTEYVEKIKKFPFSDLKQALGEEADAKNITFSVPSADTPDNPQKLHDTFVLTPLDNGRYIVHKNGVQIGAIWAHTVLAYHKKLNEVPGYMPKKSEPKPDREYTIVPTGFYS